MHRMLQLGQVSGTLSGEIVGSNSASHFPSKEASKPLPRPLGNIFNLISVGKTVHIISYLAKASDSTAVLDSNMFS